MISRTFNFSDLGIVGNKQSFYNVSYEIHKESRKLKRMVGMTAKMTF